MRIENAVIASVTIGFDRGVFLTIWINLRVGGGGVGYGGWCFDSPKDGDRVIEGPQFGLAVQKILKTFEVEKWDDLVGQPVRVEFPDPLVGSRVSAVGHFMKNKWFRFGSLFEETAP